MRHGGRQPGKGGRTWVVGAGQAAEQASQAYVVDGKWLSRLCPVPPVAAASLQLVRYYSSSPRPQGSTKSVRVSIGRGVVLSPVNDPPATATCVLAKETHTLEGDDGEEGWAWKLLLVLVGVRLRYPAALSIRRIHVGCRLDVLRSKYHTPLP